MKSFNNGAFAVSPEGYSRRGQRTPQQKKEHGHRTMDSKLGSEAACTAVGLELSMCGQERQRPDHMHEGPSRLC